MKKIKALFQLKRNDYEFLPSILEIQEKPPSPIGRMILWLLMFFITFMICWAYLGSVNIVATAQGKIIPTGQVKIVKPATEGVVKEILIKEDQFVQKGDILIELDDSIVYSQIKQTENNLEELIAKNIWQSNFLENIEKLKEIKITKYENRISERIQLRNELLFRQEIEDFASKIKIKKSEIAQLKTQKVEQETAKEKLIAILPIIKKREAALKKLYTTKMVSETEYLDLKQSLIEAEYNIKMQKNTIKSLNLQIQIKENEVQDLFSNKKLDLQNRIVENSNEIERLRLEEEQLKTTLSQHKIKSPINGYIQDLTVFTEGGVLTKDQSVLRVVPEDKELIVEAMFLNKDIGFIEKGQETTVKVDTFNFVKHGSLKGEILEISNDAIQDENLGLVFKTKIKLIDKELFINNKYIKVNSGMSVIVEAKTGRRKIINYFFNPVRKIISESIQER